MARHPLIVLSTLFCMVYSFDIFTFDRMKDQVDEAKFKVGMLKNSFLVSQRTIKKKPHLLASVL